MVRFPNTKSIAPNTVIKRMQSIKTVSINFDTLSKRKNNVNPYISSIHIHG